MKSLSYFRILGLALFLCYSGQLYALSALDFRASKFRGFHIEDIKNRDVYPIDYDALASSGANLIRLSVFLDKEDSAYFLSSEDLNSLDKIIASLAERNICTVISLRTRGDERGLIWRDSYLQQSFSDQWKNIAARYLDERYVIAFDLMNEPVPPGGNILERQKKWSAYASTLIDDIRRIDYRRIIIFQTAPDATVESFKYMRPLSYENIVYSVHSYFPFSLTHQGVFPGLIEIVDYESPVSRFKRADLHFELKSVKEFASRYSVPIFVGEFSIVRFAPNGAPSRYVADSVDYFEANDWAWVYHDFRGWTGWDSEISSSEKTDRVRSADAPVFKILTARLRLNQNIDPCWR